MTILAHANKPHWKRICLLLSFALLFVIFRAVFFGEHREVLQSQGYCERIGKYSTAAGNTKELIDFLEQFGIKALKNSEVTQKVTIPYEFNRVYENYNKLQDKVGLNLALYKGKTVDKVVYETKNNLYATLLIYRGHVIGGHISTGLYGDKYKALNKGK